MSRSATWHHNWVGFDANDFPVLFAVCDYYPTIGDIEEMPDSVVRVVKVTDFDERARLLEVHRGPTPAPIEPFVQTTIFDGSAA